MQHLRRKSFRGKEAWPYILLIVLIAAAVVGFAIKSDRDLSRQPSKPIIYVPQGDYYKSLNLSLARQASFDGQPISQVSYLGSDGNVQIYTVRFEVAKDNLSEYGLMTLPSQPASAHGYPVLILCHGYSDPHYYSTAKAYLPDMEFYSEHGFVVIKPDFRGQGLSLNVGTADGAFYSMSYNTDVMGLIADIKQTSYLNSQDISIWGHSMGAYVALRAAVVSPDIKNVILLSAPAGTVKDRFTQYRALSDLANPLALKIKADQLTAHGNPLSNPKYWEATSPLNYLKDTNAVFEINVPANDKVVPPHFSNDLASALAKAGKKYQLFVYPKATHGLVPQRTLIWKRSLHLLETNK